VGADRRRGTGGERGRKEERWMRDRRKGEGEGGGRKRAGREEEWGGGMRRERSE